MKTTDNMRDYSAIYDTESLKGVEYSFKAKDDESAKAFCRYKFSAKNITIRDDKDGREFPLN